MRHLLFLFLFVSYAATESIEWDFVYRGDKVMPTIDKYSKICNGDSLCIMEQVKKDKVNRLLEYRLHSCYMLIGKCVNEDDNTICQSIRRYAELAKRNPKKRHLDCIFFVNATQEEQLQSYKEFFNDE